MFLRYTYWGKISTYEQYYYTSYPNATIEERHQALAKDIDALSKTYNKNDNKYLKLKSFRDKLNKVSALLCRIVDYRTGSTSWLQFAKAFSQVSRLASGQKLGLRWGASTTGVFACAIRRWRAKSCHNHEAVTISISLSAIGGMVPCGAMPSLPRL
ncbi:7539_t:CDS:2 [Funneliformis caledonium]|uniref:7539_t:CDS:1 n=1 Tax=Funneliformis caledonium TaxID=1117310 RepID=A0A9N9EWE1_9GLOM|nr:7539_t:CDS:2 [Funneliformis caledonium]